MNLQHTRLTASRYLDRLHRVLEATKSLNSTLDLEELTRIILRIVKDELGVARGTLFIVDKKGVIRHAAYGVNPRGHAAEVFDLIKRLRS